jgi:AcrR family transcriptional regulator
MPKVPRRQPRQARALATRAAIFEATAQILESEGEAGFNTNRVAERAGVSIGTLYQYFGSKQAILAAMAREENVRNREALAAHVAAGGASPVRLAIRNQIHAMAGRPVTRRAALKAIMAEEGVSGIKRETYATTRLLPSMDRFDAFVLDRAVSGVIRAAVLEGSAHLADPRLEDALVRLVEAYQQAAKKEGGSEEPPSRGMTVLQEPPA